jgi:hypothetical protein
MSPKRAIPKKAQPRKPAPAKTSAELTKAQTEASKAQAEASRAQADVAKAQAEAARVQTKLAMAQIATAVISTITPFIAGHLKEAPALPIVQNVQPSQPAPSAQEWRRWRAELEPELTRYVPLFWTIVAAESMLKSMLIFDEPAEDHQKELVKTSFQALRDAQESLNLGSPSNAVAAELKAVCDQIWAKDQAPAPLVLLAQQLNSYLSSPPNEKDADPFGVSLLQSMQSTSKSYVGTGAVLCGMAFGQQNQTNTPAGALPSAGVHSQETKPGQLSG